MASPRTLALSWEQQQELETHRDHDPRPYARERYAALLKIAEGTAPSAVARHGTPERRQPDTVYGGWPTTIADGLAGLLAHAQGGNRRRRLRPRAGGGHRAAAASTRAGGSQARRHARRRGDGE